MMAWLMIVMNFVVIVTQFYIASLMGWRLVGVFVVAGAVLSTVVQFAALWRKALK